MKKIKMKSDFGVWAENGKTYIVSNQLADAVLPTLTEKHDFAILIKDMGKRKNFSKKQWIEYHKFSPFRL